jgi:hypothetical protein
MSYKECGWSPGSERADANLFLKVETIDKLREEGERCRSYPAQIVEDALAAYLPTLRQPLPEAPGCGGGRVIETGANDYGGEGVECPGCPDCSPEPESVDGEKPRRNGMCSECGRLPAPDEHRPGCPFYAQEICVLLLADEAQAILNPRRYMDTVRGDRQRVLEEADKAKIKAALETAPPFDPEAFEREKASILRWLEQFSPDTQDSDRGLAERLFDEDVLDEAEAAYKSSSVGGRRALEAAFKAAIEEAGNGR